MKPILEKIYLDTGHSIHVHMASHPNFFFPLHYHPEIEIIHVIRSFGTSIIGNSVTRFDSGDFCLIGSDVPHVFKNDKEFYEPDSKRMAEALVIQFMPECLGSSFIELPEFHNLRKMIRLSRQGVRFTGKIKKKLIDMMFEIHKRSSQERLILFINLLHEMSKTKEIEILSTFEYTAVSDDECSKINTIYDYLFKNYLKEIDFKNIASMVNMSAPSLCRYFKKHTHKTITDILNEIRIRHACKLLSTNKANAKEACYMAGFNNYSHYNKQFKKIIGRTPLHYQKQYNQL